MIDFDKISEMAYRGKDPKGDMLTQMYWEYMRVIYAVHRHGLIDDDRLETWGRNFERLAAAQEVMQRSALKTTRVINTLLAREAINKDEYTRVLREDRGC